MNSKHIKILLLEDVAAIAEAISRVLESSGTHFQIQVAGSLREYRESVTADPPDIALLDIVLPDGRSLELLTSPPEANPFPVLIMISPGAEKAAMEAMKAGALDYIVKSPQTFADMPHILNRALSHWGMLQERKQAKEALRESEERFREMFEGHYAVMLLIEPDTGSIVNANLAATKFYGYPLEALCGMKVDDINQFPPDQVALERQRVAKGERSYFIFPHRISSGEVRMVEVYSSPIKVKGQHLLFSIIHDITERKRAEEALQSQNSLLNALINSSQEVIIFSLDDKFRYTAFNEKHSLEMRKVWKADIAIGMNLPDLMTIPEAREAAMKSFERVLQGEAFIEIQRQPDLDIFYEFNWNPIRQEDGKVAGITAFIHDITERKRAEEEIAHLASFPQLNPNPILELDRNGRITFMNPALRDMLKKSGEGMDSSVFLPEDIAEILKSAESGSTVSVLREVSIGERVFQENIQYTPVRKTFRLYATDITEHKRMEEELRVSEQNFRNSIDNSPLGMRIVSRDGKTIYANRAMLDIYGHGSVEELRAVPVKERYTPESYAAHKERKGKRRRGEFVPSDYEINIVRKSGEVRYLSVFRGDVLWDGKREFQVVYQDITERKRAEEAESRARELEEINRLRSAILASVSHELRTPLTLIMGTSQILLLSNDKWDNESRDSLRVIESESRTLAHIVENLEKMALLEAGMVTMEKTPTSISKMIAGLRKRLNEMTKDHRLEITLEPQMPAIYLDQLYIGEVLTHLLSNAVAFSPKGSLITIKASRANDEIVMSVADDGIGISSEHLENIFDRFYRVESGVASRRGGVGLGLSICKSIVEAHGGRIWMESGKVKGSAFFFALPLDAEGAEASAIG